MNRKTAQLSRTHLQAAITCALDFLYRRQLPYGEFRTYAAKDKRMQIDCRFDSSLFVTAWVIDCLNDWQAARIKTMTRRALKFLLHEMEDPGIWRYWSSRNKAHEFLPPDLDDTCCISFLLGRLNRPVPANRQLILANRNTEGYFYTWMVPRANSPQQIVNVLEPLINRGAQLVWSLKGMLENIDPGVNANVLLYLGECRETQSALAYLIDVVREREASQLLSFYPERPTLYYMLSRAYRHGVFALADVSNWISGEVLATQKRNGSFGNPWLTALGVCTLLNFDKRVPELRRAIHYILDQQLRDGSWPKVAAFLGPAPYYGSEELTTAVCVQALARFSEEVD